jgi:hypothetical protein
MDKSTVVIKIKFDETSQRQIMGYLIYMGSQDARRNGDILDEKITLKGESYSNRKIINEIEQFKGYIGYMEDRPGSTGLFTDDKLRVVNVVKDSMTLNGLYYTVVISMREVDAIKYSINSKRDFEVAIKNAMPMVAKKLKIPERDFRYLAAYHLKTTEMQNNNGAGKQPHIHVIFWDQTNARKHKVMNKKEVVGIKYEISRHLLSKYQQNFYDRRNILKNKILEEVNEALNDRDRFYENYNRLYYRINVMTEQKGSLNYGRFLKECLISLSQVKNASAFNHIHNKLNEQLIILDQIQKISKDILKQSNIEQLVKEWMEVSMGMRAYQGKELANESTEIDFDAIKLIINNKIIRSASHERKEIVDWKVNHDLKSYITKGKLVYKEVNFSIKKKLAEILIKAILFDSSNKYSGDINYLIMIGKLLDISWREICHYVSEVKSSPNIEGFYIDELELVDRYLMREEVYIQYKSPSKKVYSFLPSNMKGEWVESDFFAYRQHVPMESDLKKHIDNFWKVEEEILKNIGKKLQNESTKYIKDNDSIRNVVKPSEYLELNYVKNVNIKATNNIVALEEIKIDKLDRNPEDAFLIDANIVVKKAERPKPKIKEEILIEKIVEDVDEDYSEQKDNNDIGL